MPQKHAEEENTPNYSRHDRFAKKEAEKINKILMIAGFVIVGIQIVATIVLSIFGYKLNMIPLKYYLPGVILLFIIAIAFFFMQFRRIPGIVAKVLSVIFSAFIIFLCVVSGKTIGAIYGMQGTTEIIQMNIYVMADDPASEITDTKDYQYGVLAVLDRDYTDSVISDISEEFGKDVEFSEYILSLIHI